MRISYLKDSRLSIARVKQIPNSKMERLFVTLIIKFTIMTFIILSSYSEHYSNRVNYAAFLVNSVHLEISPTSSLTA